MVAHTINGNDVAVGLQVIDTGNFERFGQAFYAALVGKNFVPLGGMHDGGAEGYIEPELSEDAEAKHFLQVSKQGTFKTKIRGTVQRLREYGRKPVSLTYISSLVISDQDSIEENLSDELDCRIRIRDAKYIETQINSNDATIAAFNSYLKQSISHLNNPGASTIASSIDLYGDRTLAVFLRQEVERRAGKVNLLESVADSLIIWAMSETDPDKGILMDRTQILAKIEEALPSAKQFMRGVIDVRLDYLRSRQSGQDRQIRFYGKEKKYCLPFATREVIKAENSDDIAIRSNVSLVFSRRLRAISPHAEPDFVDNVSRVCHSTLEKLFEHRGLLVAKFIHNQDMGDSPDEIYENVFDIVASVVDMGNFNDDSRTLRAAALQVLRGTFYDSTTEERAYLQKLSHTYVLLFVLKNEPKIVEYFKSISSKFVLYIGTDFLVRALTEHYLSPENQTTRNLFKILTLAGSTLVLTYKAVTELSSHLRRQIFEFENIYQNAEHKMTMDMVEYIDRIVIRTYFYARLAPFDNIASPPSWKDFIEQFTSYEDLRNGHADDSLARYLITKFGFTYESEEDMTASIAGEDVTALATEILKVRNAGGWAVTDKKELLAENDALQVLRVYQMRQQNREASPSNPFGFKTWWLTQDGGVRRASAKTVAAHGGQHFMMRPEFLLNFIAFAPDGHEVMRSYKEIFPTTLGVRLANRLQAGTFRQVMEEANRVWKVDEARAASMITDCINRLKSDNLKIYENPW